MAHGGGRAGILLTPRRLVYRSASRDPRPTRNAFPMANDPALQTVNMITFGGGYSLPAWVAQRQGFFARHGIAVNITHTPNSVYLMQNLIEGRFDLTVTAMDNLVAYQEGQGEAAYAGICDLVAFMGVDDSFQSLMAAPGIRTVADLRGRKIAVDALTTGYAFILREMIAR